MSILGETAPRVGQGPQTDEHHHSDESFAAFMASCLDRAPITGPPITSAPRHTEPDRESNSLTRYSASSSHHEGLNRNYAALGPLAATHTTATGNSHAGERPWEVASQHPHAEDAPTNEVWTPAAAGTISGSTERVPRRVAQPWERESLDYAQLEGDTQCPSTEADGAASSDLDLWLRQTSIGEQLTLLVRIPWVLMDIHDIMNGGRTIADVIFGTMKGNTPRPRTMESPSHWQYVATYLMAHTGAYSLNDLDWLHWRWHHRAAFRI